MCTLLNKFLLRLDILSGPKKQIQTDLKIKIWFGSGLEKSIYWVFWICGSLFEFGSYPRPGQKYFVYIKYLIISNMFPLLRISFKFWVYGNCFGIWVKFKN